MLKQGLLRELIAQVFALAIFIFPATASSSQPAQASLLAIHQARQDAFSNRVLLSLAPFFAHTDTVTLTYYRLHGARVIAAALFEGEHGVQNSAQARPARNRTLYEKIALGFSVADWLSGSSQAADSLLALMVGLIRRHRPQVVLTGLPGRLQQRLLPLMEQAFDLAADTSAFSYQLNGGLAAWQPSRLFRPLAENEKGEAVAGFDAGAVSPLWLGTHQQFMLDGFRSFALVRKDAQAPRMSEHSDLFSGLPGLEHEFNRLPGVFAGKIKRALDVVRRASQKLPAERRVLAAAALEIRNQIAGYLAAAQDNLSLPQQQSWRERAERMNKLAAQALGLALRLEPEQEFVASGDSVHTSLELINFGPVELSLTRISVHFIRTASQGSVLRNELSLELPQLKKNGLDRLKPGDKRTFSFSEKMIGSSGGEGQSSLARAQVHVRWRNRELVLQQELEIPLRPSVLLQAVQPETLLPQGRTGMIDLRWYVGKNQHAALDGIVRLRAENGVILGEYRLQMPAGPVWTVVHFQVPAHPRTRTFIAELRVGEHVLAGSETLVRQIGLESRPGVRVGLIGEARDLRLALENIGVPVTLLDFTGLSATSLSAVDVFIIAENALARDPRLASAVPRLLGQVREGARLLVFSQPAAIWNAAWNRAAGERLALTLDADVRLFFPTMVPEQQGILMQQPNPVSAEQLRQAIPGLLSGTPAERSAGWQVTLGTDEFPLVLHSQHGRGDVVYSVMPVPGKAWQTGYQLLANFISWRRPQPLTAN